MVSTIPVKINLENAKEFTLIKKDKDYFIEKTQENVFDWYQRTFEAWFMSYPGYSMWTLENYKNITQGVLDNLKKVVEKNFELPFRSVKDFCDLVNKERLALKK